MNPTPGGRPPPPPADAGAGRPLDDWFQLYRDRLRSVVALRLDRRVWGRVDPSDVLQEAFLEASQRYDEYATDPRVSPYLWLRFLTLQRVLILHRRHLGAQTRDARREQPIEAPAPEVSSFELATLLAGSATSPSDAAHRAEQQAALFAALEQLDPVDREVLTLRHFEHLSNDEAAEVLGLQPAAASQRYYRALRRLKDLFPAGA